jgi:iron complex transport system ATP-binding protein
MDKFTVNALETSRVTLGYAGKREKTLQQDLSFAVRPGELVLLIGPNGSGKSTLLRTLAGIIPPLSGSISIKGKNLGSLNPADRSRLIALVLTERITLNHLTVETLVSFGRYPYLDWLARQQDKDRQVVEEAIALCGLEELRSQTLDKLSDGERQRTMIARALAQETPLILLDEPTAHLDLGSRVEVLMLLRNLARTTRKAIVVATHELELALNLADRLWVMPSKRTFIQGIPEELVLDGTLADTFNAPQVKFDEQSGTFRISPGNGPAISVTGEDSLRVFWTIKALERNGFRTGTGPGPTVTVSPDTWEHNGKTYTRLGDLLEDLVILPGE